MAKKAYDKEKVAKLLVELQEYYDSFIFYGTKLESGNLTVKGHWVGSPYSCLGFCDVIKRQIRTTLDNMLKDQKK